MREGDFPHIQHHPAALRVIIEKSSTKSYWILSDVDGKVGGSLHRWCTAKSKNGTRHYIFLYDTDFSSLSLALLILLNSRKTSDQENLLLANKLPIPSVHSTIERHRQV